MGQGVSRSAAAAAATTARYGRRAMLANPLNVTYDCQLDNPSGDGWRECFSSSCALAAKFWLPELEINDYHRRRPNYSDSTDPSAQIRCLESFGLKARFEQMGSVQKLKAQIDRGRPAPVGFLHHGPTSAPREAGIILAIGYTEEHLIAHDPTENSTPSMAATPRLVGPTAKRSVTAGRTGPHAGLSPTTTTGGGSTFAAGKV